MGKQKIMLALLLLTGVMWAVSGCGGETAEEITAEETAAKESDPDPETDGLPYQRYVYTGENEDWKFTYEVSGMVYRCQENGKPKKKFLKEFNGSASYQNSLEELNKTQKLEIIWSDPESGSSAFQEEAPFSKTEFYTSGRSGNIYSLTGQNTSSVFAFGENEETQIQVIVSHDGEKEMVTLTHEPQRSDQSRSFVLTEHGQNQDGTWRTADDQTYRYRLELTGRIPNAAADTTFVVLSNREDLSFEEVWKASGLSSDTEDFFDPEEAAIVKVIWP